MLSVHKIMLKARTSAFYLWLLNFGLSRAIPFNRPHGIKIIKVGEREITTFIPYKKKNLNHIKGIHACAMATLAEFTTGFLLMSNLNAKRYRLIMKKLEIEFHYQGKMDATASFNLTEDWMAQNVTGPLGREGQINIDCKVNVMDRDQNHLSTCVTTWQIKDWQQVRTKM